MSRRLAAGLAAAIGLAGVVVLVATAPRLTVLNEGFRLEYGGLALVGAAAAAVGATFLAAVLRATSARFGCALLAIAAVVVGVQRGAWQVGADGTALSARSLTETSRIAWKEVRQVHSDTEALHVSGYGDTLIRIGISGLRPHDRATLERTISRRVQETAPAASR